MRRRAWLRVEVRGQLRPALQLAVVEVKLLGLLAPAVRVEVVVRAPLVGRGLLQGGHTRRLRDPHLFLRVVPPFPVVSATDKQTNILLMNILYQMLTIKTRHY